MKTTLTSAIATAVTCAFVLTGCSSTTQNQAIQVENCGATVSFAKAPERVTTLNNAPILTLHELGVLGMVKHRAGVYPRDYYSDELNSEIDKIPSLSDKLDTDGHLVISKEQVISGSPDLVLGESASISRETLASMKTPLIDEPGFCGALNHDVTFNDVYDQIRTYGTVFDRKARADEYIGELQKRVADIESHEANGKGRTVAVLYPTIGGGVTYAYGSRSMSNPVVQAAGLKNLFAEQQERVFEVNAEELLARNPDVIIALHTAGDPQATVDAVRQIPGADSLAAVQNNKIMPLLLNFAEPPTPLAVDGLAKVNDFLAAN